MGRLGRHSKGGSRGRSGSLNGVERHGLEPDAAQLLTDLRFRQLVQGEAVGAGVGERCVGGTGPGEFGVELDRVADVHDDNERRAALCGGQGTGVLFCLAVCPEQGAVEARPLRLPDSFRLADECTPAVKIYEPSGFRAIAVPERHPAFEDVGVVAGVVGRGIWMGQVEQSRQLGEEELVVGPFATGCGSPAGDKGGDLAIDVLRLWDCAHPGSATGRQQQCCKLAS